MKTVHTNQTEICKFSASVPPLQAQQRSEEGTSPGGPSRGQKTASQVCAGGGGADLRAPIRAKVSRRQQHSPGRSSPKLQDDRKGLERRTKKQPANPGGSCTCNMRLNWASQNNPQAEALTQRNTGQLLKYRGGKLSDTWEHGHNVVRNEESNFPSST